MTVEEQCIKIIENGIRALRMRTKTPKEINVGKSFNTLKELNLGMYEELLTKYKRVLNDYNGDK